jgi:hypothetical protein
MHPSGFDTRAVTSEDAAALLAIANDNGAASALSGNPGQTRLRDILEANSFLSKMDFVRAVLSGWVKWGRLGGRPDTSGILRSSLAALRAEDYSEIFWRGTQEWTSSSGKYVWVTVGAQGGDGEYIALGGGTSDRHEEQMAGTIRRVVS